jgi:hypothetical protein
MTTLPGTISARLSAQAPQVEVLTPLALVLGSRAGLSIEQIDDLAMALELLVRHQPTTSRRVSFATAENRLEISLSDIDQEWLERRRPMLECARLGGHQRRGRREAACRLLSGSRGSIAGVKAVDDDAGAALVSAMTPLVADSPSGSRPGAALDLEQAGMVGLLQAAQSFDPERGTPLAATRRRSWSVRCWPVSDSSRRR